MSRGGGPAFPPHALSDWLKCRNRQVMSAPWLLAAGPSIMQVRRQHGDTGLEIAPIYAD